MHIINVTHSFPRWDGDVAGAFIERLTVALQRRSHAISVIVPADRGRGGTAVRRDAIIKRVRYGPARRETIAYTGRMLEAAGSIGGMGMVAGLVLAQSAAIIDMVRRSPGSVVHAHWWVPNGVAAWLSSSVSGAPYVVTLHGTDVAVLERSEVARRIARLVLRRATRLTAVSSYLADRVAQTCGIDRRTIVIQPMPVESGRFEHKSSGGGGVVTVGRLVAQKRIDRVLEAVALLRRGGRSFQLKVVGDGPDRSTLEQQARDLGIGDTTEFVGSVEPESIPATIGDADVFVFPAIREGLGLAAAEAFMLGVPVVASREGGGVLDIVPPDGAGRLVERDSVTELARAITELTVDPTSRELAAERGRRLKALLDPDRVAQVFEDVYAGVLGGGTTEVA